MTALEALEKLLNNKAIGYDNDAHEEYVSLCTLKEVYEEEYNLIKQALEENEKLKQQLKYAKTDLSINSPEFKVGDKVALANSKTGRLYGTVLGVRYVYDVQEELNQDTCNREEWELEYAQEEHLDSEACVRLNETPRKEESENRFSKMSEEEFKEFAKDFFTRD